MARWIFFGLFLAYYIVLSVSSFLTYDKIVAAILSGRMSRAQVYLGQMAGMGLPCAVLIVLAAFGLISFGELGIAWFTPGASVWLVITAAGLYSLYLAYLLYSFVSMRKKAASGRFRQDIPDRMRALYPATKKEKRLWIVTAISAGVTEELLFRGFLIGSASVLFPSLPIALIIAFSVLLFGAGHIYQGLRRAAAPALIGLLLGVCFLAFGSLLPLILVHILQDICAVFVLKTEQESLKS